MTFCDPIKTDEPNIYVCSTCKKRIWSRFGPEMIFHDCAGAVAGASVEKVRRYGAAVARWIQAGRPTRPKGEVLQILDTICKPCGHYQNGKCGHCGCAVNAKQNGLRNKIKMATEHCPLGKW